MNAENSVEETVDDVPVIDKQVIDEVEAEEVETEQPQAVKEPVEPKKINTFFDDKDFDNIRSQNAEMAARFEERLKQDTTEKYALKNENKSLKDELAELKQKLLEKEKPQEIQLPTEDDFYSDPEGAKARMQQALEAQKQHAAWEAQNSQLQDEIKHRQRQAQAEVEQQFYERSAKAGLEKADVDRWAIQLTPDFQAIPEVGQLILEHEQGGVLLKELAENPSKLQEIKGMSVARAGAELERIAQSRAYKPKTKSSAPPPDEPLVGTSKIPSPYGGLVNEGGFS